MHEAILYERMSDQRVRCHACAHECTISAGHRGLCAVRENVGGRLQSLVYGKVIARDADPIEKKPLFHFMPGSRAYSVATVGCNFVCDQCQNHYISQYPRVHGGQIVGDDVTPRELVDGALAAGCGSIAFTYTEPTIAVEFVLDAMRLARRAGLRNVWISNGYFSHETAVEIIPLLDAANIDLKSISDEVYHEVFGGTVRPVLNSIERLVSAGVWVEVTTLLIPGLNDSDDQLRWTAEAVAGISPRIPWHLSRFFPAYRMVDRPPTPIERLVRGRELGREAGLAYVYLGNLPGEGETTACSQCGARLIERAGYLVRHNRVQEGTCPECGAEVDGVFLDACSA